MDIEKTLNDLTKWSELVGYCLDGNNSKAYHAWDDKRKKLQKEIIDYVKIIEEKARKYEDTSK